MFTVLLAAETAPMLPCYLSAASYATPPSCQAPSFVHRKLKHHSPLLPPPDVH